MGDGPCIPFFTDQNVPNSVGNTLASVGHHVTRLRDRMPTDTADPVVGVACIKSGQVLVSHDKDFKQVAKQLQISQREYHCLHRIALRCDEVNSAMRIKDALSLIEHEWNYCKEVAGRKLLIEISNVAIRTVRWLGT